MRGGTVREWLEILHRDRPAAMVEAWHACEHSCGEEASEVLLRILDGDGASARRAPPGTLLAAWCAGIARNVRREEARARGRLRTLVEDPPSGGDPPSVSGPGVGIPEEAPLDRTLSDLTEKQEEAVRALERKGIVEDAAGGLGLTRAAFLDRIRRAARRVQGIAGAGESKAREGNRASSLGAREWACRLLESGRVPWTGVDRRRLEAYAAGRTLAELGEAWNCSPEAAKCRMRRLRRKYGFGRDGRVSGQG